MERAEAFKALRLDQSADGTMVEKAYWTLVRQAQQHAAGDNGAGSDIERLNEAYATLAPGAQHYVPARTVSAPGGEFIDHLADWVAREALRTRKRWSQRNPEIALMGGAVLVLMVLALGEGASVLATFICVGLAFVAIWAPWRRASLDDELPE